MSNCNSCGGCGGNGCGGNGCGSCSGGCGRNLTLTPQEISILEELMQSPFLPVARKADDMTPIYLEGTEFSREEYSMILAHLDRKGLIDIDYRNPLSGFDYASYAGYPVHGSIALTERGHTVIELMEMQGIGEE